MTKDERIIELEKEVQNTREFCCFMIDKWLELAVDRIKTKAEIDKFIATLYIELGDISRPAWRYKHPPL